MFGCIFLMSILNQSHLVELLLEVDSLFHNFDKNIKVFGSCQAAFHFNRLN
jgi:hypothetical protein